MSYKKTIYKIENIIDILIDLVWILVFLFGVYWVYDAYQIINNANDETLTTFKPNENETLIPSLNNNIAWLIMEDSDVDFPIMQGLTNEDFLSTDPYGNYSLSGSIFLDSRNSDDFKDDYNLLYGHHMENYGMFGALDKWLDEEYFKEHQYGTLTTTSAIYKLEIIAIAQINADDSPAFKTSEVSLASIQNVIKNNYIYINNDISQEHILALSTCADATSSIRTVIFTNMTLVKEDTKQDISKSKKEISSTSNFDFTNVLPVEANKNVLDELLKMLGWN